MKLYQLEVENLMTQPPARIIHTDSMDVVMHKFDETKAWNLPVEDEDGVWLGFVSRSKIFGEYRKLLVNFSDE